MPDQLPPVADADATQAEGAKHYDEAPMVGMARSFDEWEQGERARAVARNVRELGGVLDGIVSNILWDHDMDASQKAAAIRDAADQFAERAGMVEQGQGERAQGERKGVFAKIRGALGLGPDAIEEERRRAAKELPEGDVGVFQAFKSEDGLWRWSGIYTNRYADAEGEIFPAAAHKAYEGYVAATKDYPELRAWHIPGARLGVAELVTYDEDTGFMAAVGRFDDGMEAAAKSLAEHPEPLGMSHGFSYPLSGKVAKVYAGGYKSFEVSVLPMRKAANKLTGFGVEPQEEGMKAEQRAFIASVMGEDRAAELETQMKSLAEKAQAEGIAFKDLFEDLVQVNAGGTEGSTAAPPTAAATTPPASPPVAAQPSEPGGGEAAPAPAGDGEKDIDQSWARILAPIIAQAQNPLIEAINALDEKTKELGDRIAEGEKSDAERIADAMRPKRLAPHVLAEKAASQRGDTVVRGNAAIVQDAKEMGAGGSDPMSFYIKGLRGEPVAQAPDIQAN